MTSRSSCVPMIGLLLVAAAIVAGWLGQPAVSGGADPNDAPSGKWEYVTGSIEPGALQARLTELGKDGWTSFPSNGSIPPSIRRRMARLT